MRWITFPWWGPVTNKQNEHMQCRIVVKMQYKVAHVVDEVRAWHKLVAK
jgi:hypothetical protein